MPATRDTKIPRTEAKGESDFFVPDLCRVKAVFFLLIISELLVLLMAILHAGPEWIDWQYFGMTSLFVQWTVLTSAALICSLRRWLQGFTTARATLLITALVLLDVLIFSTLADQLLPVSHGRTLLQMVGRNLLAALIVTLMLLRYFYLQYQWRRQKQAEMQSRMVALQARIHPHFLFNSMNTIASLITTRPEEAEDAVLDLSELFRASLGTQARLIPLHEELHLCHRYLAIEALRLGKRLTLQWVLDDTLDHQVIPPLTLQPLVENAIYHGIQPRAEGGLIRVETYRKRNAVYILVQNPAPTIGQETHQGNRIALANIRDRLEALFDDQALLKQSNHEGLYTVTLRLPWQTLSGDS